MCDALQCSRLRSMDMQDAAPTVGRRGSFHISLWPPTVSGAVHWTEASPNLACHKYVPLRPSLLLECLADVIISGCETFQHTTQRSKQGSDCVLSVGSVVYTGGQAGKQWMGVMQL